MVVLDHVAKSGNANTARGSGRKKEEFDAQFEFKKSKNFTTHSAGEIQLITTKDRESILPIRTTFSVGANEEDSFVFDLKSVDTAGEKKPTWKLSFHDLPPKEQAAIEVLRTFGTQGARDKDWIGAGGGNTSKSTIDRVKKRFKQGELAKNVLGYNEKASKYFTSVKPQTAQSRITSGTIGAFDNLVSLEDFLVSEPDVAS